MFRDDYDEWLCMKCQRTWQTKSVPHRPECRSCGEGGWWQRFVKGLPYETSTDSNREQLER